METGAVFLAWLAMGAALAAVVLERRRWVQGAVGAGLVVVLATGAAWFLAGAMLHPGAVAWLLSGVGAAAGCYVEAPGWRGALGSYAVLILGVGLLLAAAWLPLAALVGAVLLAAGVRAFLWVAPGSS